MRLKRRDLELGAIERRNGLMLTMRHGAFLVCGIRTDTCQHVFKAFRTLTEARKAMRREAKSNA